MRKFFLPAILFIFTLLSTITLSSVTPLLAGRQLFSFLLAGVLFFVVSQIPFSRYMQLRWLLYGSGIILLLIPLFVFGPTRGTHRWIDIGGVYTLQSSQFALPATLFVLIYSLISTKQFDWQKLFKFFAIFSVPATLILIEPDLGSTIAFALPLLALVPSLPFSWKKLVILAVSGILLSIFAWHFVLKEYQKVRFMAFLQPESADNYNAHQALITVGSGKLFGRGIGQGVQSHLEFLPERQTDFIFASFAEEYGFFGCLILLSIYAGLIIFLYVASKKSKEPAEKLFLLAVSASILFQASINIHMNLGLLPITGITLPFMSYGGSSILGLAILLGISQNIVQHLPNKSALHIT